MEVKFYVGWKDDVKQVNRAAANIIGSYDCFYTNPFEIYEDVIDLEREEKEAGTYNYGHYVIFVRSDYGTRIYALNAFRKEFNL